MPAGYGQANVVVMATGDSEPAAGMHPRWSLRDDHWSQPWATAGPGMQARHVVCDNPPCVNPAHLAEGTARDNVRDRDSKGRQARGDRNPASTLVADDVRAIRSAYASGTSQATLARRMASRRPTLQDRASPNVGARVRTERCTCGGTITADTQRTARLVAAVRDHGRSVPHQVWRAIGAAWSARCTARHRTSCSWTRSSSSGTTNAAWSDRVNDRVRRCTWCWWR